MKKIIGAERFSAPWYESLEPDEIKAALSSDSITWNPTTNTLTIEIAQDHIFNAELGDEVHSVSLDKEDARNFLKVRGLSDDEIEFYFGNDVTSNKPVSLQEVKDDAYWGVGVRATKNSMKRLSVDDYFKKVMDAYLKSTGLDKQVKKVSAVHPDFETGMKAGCKRVKHFAQTGFDPGRLTQSEKLRFCKFDWSDTQKAGRANDFQNFKNGWLVAWDAYQEPVVERRATITLPDPASKDYWKKVLKDMGAETKVSKVIDIATELIRKERRASSPVALKLVMKEAADAFKQFGGLSFYRQVRHEINTKRPEEL